MVDYPNDEEVQLFEKQKRIYPKRTEGRYRTIKWIAMVVCLGIYYCIPFLRWDRGASAPDQAVMFDLERGRAYFFWFEIWPQEVYILTAILILAAIGLFFVTSLLGRVWCGYLCFQTVWTDLFIWVERIIQGDRNKRLRLREGPWTFEKIYKVFFTHVLWICIGILTAGAFVLYFNDAPTLIQQIINLDVSRTVLLFIAGLSASTYIMAGFAREQVCTFMCPYARFQSAMFDKDTLIIGYDEHRGEKRGKHKKGQSWDDRGHCIDCTACVQVCPMGIDIRDGLQMECIACGLCIDACNNIMDKVGLPRGLIRYDTESRLEAKKSDVVTWRHFLRTKTCVYFAVMVICCGMMLSALLNRTPLEFNVLHDRNPLFVQLSNGDIRNGYELKILNKTHEAQEYKLTVIGLDNPVVRVNKAGHGVPEGIEGLYVDADSVGSYRVFIQTMMRPQPPRAIQFVLENVNTAYTVQYDSMFISQTPKR